MYTVPYQIERCVSTTEEAKIQAYDLASASIIVVSTYKRGCRPSLKLNFLKAEMSSTINVNRFELSPKPLTESGESQNSAQSFDLSYLENEIAMHTGKTPSLETIAKAQDFWRQVHELELNPSRIGSSPQGGVLFQFLPGNGWKISYDIFNSGKTGLVIRTPEEKFLAFRAEPGLAVEIITREYLSQKSPTA